MNTLAMLSSLAQNAKQGVDALHNSDALRAAAGNIVQNEVTTNIAQQETVAVSAPNTPNERDSDRSR